MVAGFVCSFAAVVNPDPSTPHQQHPSSSLSWRTAGIDNEKRKAEIRTDEGRAFVVDWQPPRLRVQRSDAPNAQAP